MRLLDGYDTVAGEAGSTLSGGKKTADCDCAGVTESAWHALRALGQVLSFMILSGKSRKGVRQIDGNAVNIGVEGYEKINS